MNLQLLLIKILITNQLLCPDLQANHPGKEKAPPKRSPFFTKLKGDIELSPFAFEPSFLSYEGNIVYMHITGGDTGDTLEFHQIEAS